MKWIKELILFLFFCTNTFTQSIKVDEIVPPQGFGIGLLNYSGNSSIINNVSNFGNYSFGFSYQLNSNIEEGWINNSIVKRQNDFLPQSVGGIVRWNDIILGAGYQQKYPALEKFFNRHLVKLLSHQKDQKIKKTNNIAENINRRLMIRLKTIESFKNFNNAENYLNLYKNYLRFKPYTDCKGNNKIKNGKSPLKVCGAVIKNKDWLNNAVVFY